MLYASQMGWLHARPSGQTGEARTRLGLITEAGREPLLPELDEAEYIARYWHELGRVEQGGMGPAILSGQELMAWQAGTGIRLNTWEFRMLRQMSSAYIQQLMQAEKPEAPAPYGKTIDNLDRDRVDHQIRSAFRTLMQSHQSHQSNSRDNK